MAGQRDRGREGFYIVWARDQGEREKRKRTAITQRQKNRAIKTKAAGPH